MLTPTLSPQPAPRNAWLTFNHALAEIARENLHEWLRKIRELEWTSGNSKHQQLQSGFSSAARMEIEPTLAQETLVEMIETHGGSVNLRDVVRIRNWAYNSDEKFLSCRQPKTLFDEAFAQEFSERARVTDPVKFIRSCSAVSTDQLSAASALRTLFFRGEKILIFTDFMSQGQCVYDIDSDNQHDIPERGPEGVWFLIQPIDGATHSNPREEDKTSRRSQESVTSYRYMLLESDELDENTWLRIVVQLPLRTAAIYRSGNKSIHVLVRVDASSKEHYDEIKARMMPLLVTLGADRAALTAVRLSRLPQAWRGDQCQDLLYLQPNPPRKCLMDFKPNNLTPENNE
jgi:hypothetical protein